MDEVLKKMFESGPPEMTGRQLDKLCAEMAMSFVKAYEPDVLISRDDQAYGFPKLPEELTKR